MTGRVRWWLHPVRTVWALLDAFTVSLVIRSSEAWERATTIASFDVTKLPGCAPTEGVPSLSWREPGSAHDGPDAA